jgi:transcriptional regulator with XRE-family HTH domain
MLSEYLKTLKANKKLTNAKIASMSGISESTISRMMNGEGKSVDLASVLKVVVALEGSLDDACGITNKEQSESELREFYKDMILDITNDHKNHVEMLKETIKEKRMWIKRLFIICCILLGFVILQWTADALTPNIGWLRW